MDFFTKNKGPSLSAVILILIGAALVSCGVKGPPEPPYPSEASTKKTTPVPSSSAPPEQVVEPLTPPTKPAATPFSTKKIKTNKPKKSQ